MKRLGMVLAIFYQLGCRALLPATPIAMEPDEYAEYYRQFDNRSSNWFCGVYVTGEPCAAKWPVPTAEQTFGEFRWVETYPAGESNRTCVCSHGSSSSKVKIPADRWDSGCPSHEIGHGVLKRLGHPCWKDYEHINPAPERCKVRR